MTPILYEKDEIDFTSQGLGALVEIYDVDVAEQRNGLLQLTASYPVSGVRYADISVGRIILAKPNQRDDVHAFRIVNTELDISGYALMIEADSITYDLTHNVIKHLVASGNGQSFMTALKNAIVNPSIFDFYSDIATTSSTSLDYVNPMEAIIGVQGSFLQIWGGEIKRENRRVAMFNRRGRDNVSTFRLGKNISGLKYSVNISSLVTRIIPTKSVQNDDQTTTILEGAPVDSQYINNYEQIYTLPLEFTDDTIKTVDDLNEAAKSWFVQSANTGRDKPTVTIDIDVLSLQDSADYQDKFKNLESVSLTDTVTVYVPEYGVNVTAIVNELHYDPILDRVTKMTVGTAKQSFADSSRTQLSDLQDKIISVQNQADATAVSANGKNKNYYGSVQPSHPQEGDQWYWQDGDKSGIKQFINGEWMPLIDSNTQEKIEAGVNEAIAQANENTVTAIEENNISQQEVMNDIAKSQADLAIKDGDFNNKAQAMADEALANAKANTATVAQETLNTANENLDAAKKSLTIDLQKEVSDRTTAVATLDFKAQGYADSAKQDAIAAATTADGTINKKIDETASSLTSKITQNKQDADGKITTAQSTATQALNEVKTKVSQTEYNTKTGQLTTDVNSVTQTANQSKQDIVSINQKDGQQDSRMNTIESDASGTKQTVSDIQTKQGQQDASISTLQTRADGIEANVSKAQTAINDLQQINQIPNSEFIPDFAGWHSGSDQAIADETSDIPAGWYRANGRYHSSTAVGNVLSTGINSIHTDLIPVGQGVVITGSAVGYSASNYNGTVTLAIDFAYYDSSKKLISNNRTNSSILTDWTRITLKATTPSNTSYVSFGIVTNGNVGTNYYSQPLLVFADVLGNYVRGSYNNNGATAKAQLTADLARTELTNYKTDADGRISKTQSDVTQTAALVATKVSQSDYDKKTGQLSTDVSNAQQTADSAVTTIGSYKTSNDNRVSAAESKISQNADDITLRATKSDLDAAKSDYTEQIAQVKVDAQAVTTTVSQIQTTVNKLNQNNLVNNSQLNPDYSGWHAGSPWGNSITGEIWNNGIESSTGAMWVWHNWDKTREWIYSDPIAILPGIALSASITAAMPTPPSSGVPLALYVYTYDANKTRIDSFGMNIGYNMVSGTFTKFNLDNRIASSGARYASLVFGWNVGGQISFGKPMLVFGATTGDYVAGPYNNNDKVSSLQVSLDGITSTVSKTTSDVSALTSRVQTAEGTLSTATDNISGLQSKQTQTANQITQEISDRTDGDKNTLQSSKDFTTSNITSAVSGLNSTISQTASGILVQVETQNMVTNSEFDPLNYGWFAASASVGATVGAPWNPNATSSFLDWPAAGGSRLISYNVATWFTSELKTGSAGKVYSGSIVAGRASAPAQSTALDLRIAFWDKNKALLATSSSGNIIDGASYKGLAKYVIENKAAPTGTLYVSLMIAHSGAADDVIGRPMLNVGSTAAPYTPTTATTSSSTILSLLKDNWSIGISDNIGNITSGIVGNSSSMSLISKNITLDGNTTVTGDFYAKGGNFTNLNASNITFGTLNGNQVNITNLNASNIVSGAISGANLNINLNTGQVQFQKGRINSSDYTTDINIDQGYISTANDNTRALIKQGMIQLVAPNSFDLQPSPYMEISNNRGQNTAGAAIIGRDSVSIANSKNATNIFPAPIGKESFSGFYTGQAFDGAWLPTKVSGADRGVVVAGGTETTWQVLNTSPYIWVGTNATGSSGYGNRVVIKAEYLHATTVYNHGGSTAANVYVASDGAILKSSSATKYKTNIVREVSTEQVDKLLTIDPATWNDKFEAEQLERYHETGIEPERQINMEGKRYYGIIAEDLVKAGLEELVTRNEETDEVEGVEYSKIGVALIPVVRDLRNRLNEQYVEIERLKDKIK
ncbi:phage tail spike protein [Leuconostoc suionicum]|uniref:phage tail spike protein n=1 Tax=Leuconostoc suionicum TaxID=1511761 RepID=UPI00233F4348|nr:phage tail spike protein [Leuconostoc suionicum]MDC2805548.1 gp58-like family protein [Leuconostoc suionicum]MDC2823060.1 gp58-like family protein [Leuconostoc suionicum]